MLSAFKVDLTERSLAKENHVPFYLKEAGDYYAFLNAPHSTMLSVEAKQRFLLHVSKSHDDRKVRQAENSLRLYICFLAPRRRASANGARRRPEGNKPRSS